MKISSKILLKATLLICFTLFSQKIFATHLVGGDLTYERVSSLKYEITLNYYFDCDGNRSAFEANPTVSYYSNTCGYSNTIDLDTLDDTGKDIAPLCNKYESSCKGGNKKGIEKWIFKDTVTLPQKCSDWVFSWDQVARNKAITTIDDPGSDALYLETQLNNKKFPSNSSPYFTNDPVAFICNNQEYVYNHGAKDPDGDSLVYSFYEPKTDQYSTVDYLPGYSYDNPLKSVPDVSIDPQSGNITMKPTQKDVTVLGVKVKEYDTTGELKGVILRDIQVLVKNCTSSNAPQLTGFTPYNDGFDTTNTNQDTTVCPGQPLDLYVGANDPDPEDSLFMSWNKGIKGAKFEVIGDSTKKPVGKLSWVSRNPNSGFKTRRYSYTVNVRDDNCPYYTNIVKGYAIDVIPSKRVDLGDTAYVACDDSLRLSPDLKGVDSNYTIVWNTGQTTDSIWVKEPGTYWVSVSDSGECAITDSIEVLPSLNPDYDISPSFSANRGCINDTIQFYDSSSSEKSTVNSWFWRFGDGDSAKIQNPRHKYQDTGNYLITLIIQDKNDCQDTLEKQIAIDSKPVADFTFNLSCSRNQTQFIDQTKIRKGSTPLHFWKFGDGSMDTATDPTHIYPNKGQYQVRQIAESGGGCRDTAYKNIRVHPTPRTHFFTKNACLTQKTQFIDTSKISGSGSIASYHWRFSPKETSTAQNPKFRYQETGAYPVELITTSQKGCKDTLTKSIRVFLPSRLNIKADSIFCKGDSIQTKTQVQPRGFNIFKDHFANDTFSPNWDTIYNGEPSLSCGSVHKKALYFSGDDRREAITQNIDTRKGDSISFYIKYGDGAQQCDRPEIDEQVYLEYSTDGTNWKFIAQLGTNLYRQFTKVSFSIPADAKTPATKFRLRQANFTNCFNGECYDHWAIDQFKISVKPSFEYSWKPKKGISGTSLKEPSLAPSKATTYTLHLKEKKKQCTVTDSLYIKTPIDVKSGFSTSAPGCSGTPIHFKDTSKIRYGALANRKWFLGDGTTTGRKEFKEKFESRGKYPVKLTKTSQRGCSDSTTKVIQIIESPTAKFAYDTSCESTLTHFINQSSIQSGPISSWKWHFGTGDTAITKSPEYRYKTDSTYPVMLIAGSKNTCYDTFTKPIKVKAKPNAEFKVFDSLQCINNNIFNFQNLTIGENQRDYVWDFDNKDNSRQENPTYSYDEYGNYKVQLRANSENGCKDTAFKKLKVAPKPKSDFKNTRVCHGDKLRFKDQSSIPEGRIREWYYRFGDGWEDFSQNPIHEYQEPGKYEVRQITTSSHGCRDSVTKQVIVYGDPGISNIRRVTVKNDENILVEWDSIPTPNPGRFALERAKGRKGFKPITKQPEGQTSYLDEGVQVDDTVYTYRVQILDSCGNIGKYSKQKGTSIKLSVSEGLGEPVLNWTPYRGWSVNHYAVQKLNPVNGEFRTISGYEQIPGDSLSILEEQTRNTNKKRCYRIIGYKQGDEKTFSISNTDCLDREMRLYVPDAFSPNDDGINDQFGVKGTYVVNYQISIYNRWGQKLYESHSMENSWDGKFKGKPVSTGRYLYIIWAEGPNGETRQVKGTIKVLK